MFVFIDTETTGLDTKKAQLLELAIVICDNDLKPKAYTQRIFWQPMAVLDAMDTWCKKTHTETGLLDKVKTSQCFVNEGTDASLVAWLQQNTTADEQHPMCGNSVHFDRSVLLNRLPQLHSFFSHRNIDVSSFVEVYRRWQGAFAYPVNKGKTHRALSDCMHSIETLLSLRRLWGV